MKSLAATIQQLEPQDLLLLATAWVAALVLSSLDQCTRGPSVTAMVLTHLNTIL